MGWCGLWFGGWCWISLSLNILESIKYINLKQDAEVGDGTTSVVLLAAEILKQVKVFVEDGLHPQVCI